MTNVMIYVVIVFQSVFNAIDHHWKEPMFATTGDVVEIWNEERTEPVRSFTWGVDSINSLKFNPIEVRRYPLNPYAADGAFYRYKMMQKT